MRAMCEGCGKKRVMHKGRVLCNYCTERRAKSVQILGVPIPSGSSNAAVNARIDALAQINELAGNDPRVIAEAAYQVMGKRWKGTYRWSANFEFDRRGRRKE